MTQNGSPRLALAAASVLMLAGCATPHTEPLPPVIRIVEVKVQVPVPCPALVELGEEPIYPDTDAAIQGAGTISALAVLYKVGRLMRGQRLAEYQAAKTACNF